jgi:hypothetical protein
VSMVRNTDSRSIPDQRGKCCPHVKDMYLCHGHSRRCDYALPRDGVGGIPNSRQTATVTMVYLRSSSNLGTPYLATGHCAEPNRCFGERHGSKNGDILTLKHPYMDDYYYKYAP